MAKQGMDLHTSTLVQMLAYDLLTQKTGESEFLTNHVRMIRDTYRERRDVMLEAMETYFPEGVQWTRPQGGLFLWVTLPEWLDSAALLQDAIANNVAYVPGSCFRPEGGEHNSLRLNFSYSKPELIVVGIRRLGEVISRALDRASAEQRRSEQELRASHQAAPETAPA
jgi:2-aminoadipate transaminase